MRKIISKFLVFNYTLAALIIAGVVFAAGYFISMHLLRSEEHNIVGLEVPIRCRSWLHPIPGPFQRGFPSCSCHFVQ